LALLGAGVSDDRAWRVMLALGAVPAAAVIYLRCRMPESPRYQIQVQGKAEQAASRMSQFTGGQVSGVRRAARCRQPRRAAARDGAAGIPHQPEMARRA
jgi:hypothetical protein